MHPLSTSNNPLAPTDSYCCCCCCCYVFLPQLPFTTCAYELGFFGVNLKKLVLANNKDFLFSEVGVGGGSYDGR